MQKALTWHLQNASFRWCSLKWFYKINCLQSKNHFVGTNRDKGIIIPQNSEHRSLMFPYVPLCSHMFPYFPMTYLRSSEVQCKERWTRSRASSPSSSKERGCWRDSRYPAPETASPMFQILTCHDIPGYACHILSYIIINSLCLYVYHILSLLIHVLSDHPYLWVKYVKICRDMSRYIKIIHCMSLLLNHAVHLPSSSFLLAESCK